MTYAIGEIIFGINLTQDSDVSSLFDKTTDEDDLDAFLDGACETSYSGNGTAPCYFGIAMGSLDECTNERGSSIIQQMTPSDAHRAAYQEKLEEFLADESYSEDFRDIVKNAQPDVWLLWGSS